MNPEDYKLTLIPIFILRIQLSSTENHHYFINIVFKILLILIYC